MTVGWWYLSFASDDGFLGGAFVEGFDIVTATMRAHKLGVNPGGEVMGIPLEDGKVPPEQWRERLLSRQQLDEFDAEMGL